MNNTNRGLIGLILQSPGVSQKEYILLTLNPQVICFGGSTTSYLQFESNILVPKIFMENVTLYIIHLVPRHTLKYLAL